MTERDAIRKVMRENPVEAERLRRLAREGKLQGTDTVPDAEDLTVVAGPWPSNINGSKQVRCASCGALLSIAPSTQDMMAARSGKTTIKCLGCVTKPTAETLVC